MYTPSLREVTEWGCRQAQYLTPTQHHVLMVLVVNAFLTDENPEGALPGQVYRARSSYVAIRRLTGLSERTVREALYALQDQAYLVAQMSKGRGQSQINVLWTPEVDQIREDLRAGLIPLPPLFRRAVNAAPEAQMTEKTDVIIPFPNRQQLPV